MNHRAMVDGLVICSADEFIPRADVASGSERLEEAEGLGSLDVSDSWTPDKPKWELKELKPLHRQVASLLAQGAKNVEIAAICNITPQYVAMLIQQPLVKAYIAEMCEIVGVRMEALFAQSVDVIADTMQNGSESGKLKAARLQLEATKRIGRIDPNSGLERGSVDRLERLADRLISLQSNIRKGRTFDENGTEIAEA